MFIGLAERRGSRAQGLTKPRTERASVSLPLEGIEIGSTSFAGRMATSVHYNYNMKVSANTCMYIFSFG